MNHCGAVFVAALNGSALGGGFELHVGGSMELEDGLALEHAEFHQILSSPRGQDLMLAYQISTEAHQELPLYRPGTYAAALTDGSLPAATY